MSSSESESDGETEIRRKQREEEGEEALSVFFDDPLHKFACSDNEPLRNVSQELANREDTIKVRIRAFLGQLQEELGSFSPARVQSFVKQRESLVEELATHLKSSRAVIREAREQNIVDSPTAKRLLSGMEEVDAEILKERAALAKNRAKLEYAILGHPTHARIGQAYPSAIVERLPNPAGGVATSSVQTSRDERDQRQFRSLLIQAYSPPELAEHKKLLWCPVSRMWHDRRTIEAVHLVPYALGEVNVSHIFGLPQEDGYKAIWSYKNGLLLHGDVEEALNAGRVVIVPAEDSPSESKLVALDDELLGETVCYKGPTYAELNNTNLQFLSESRPAKRSLYFRCLITLFRRFRYYGMQRQEKGEGDQQKIKWGKVWGTPGKWMSAKILKALAYEIGDIVHVDKVFEGIVDYESSEEMGVDERDRKVAVQVRETVEGGDEEEF